MVNLLSVSMWIHNCNENILIIYNTNGFCQILQFGRIEIPSKACVKNSLWRESKYQISLAALLFSRLYSVHLYWWKRLVICDLWDHCTQARKSAGERSTLDLKPVRKDTRSPKQEQSVASQTGPWSNKICFKKIDKVLTNVNGRNMIHKLCVFVITLSKHSRTIDFRFKNTCAGVSVSSKFNS